MLSFFTYLIFYLFIFSIMFKSFALFLKWKRERKGVFEEGNGAITTETMSSKIKAEMGVSARII